MNLARLVLIAFALIGAASSLGLGIGAGTIGIIAFCVGSLLGVPFGYYYTEPATRRTAMERSRGARPLIVGAAILGTSFALPLATALGLTEALFVCTAAVGGAIAVSLLYTAIQSDTMNLVEVKRRARDRFQ